MVAVREATVADIVALEKYAKKAHANSSYAYMPYSGTVVRTNFRQMIFAPQAIVLLAEDEQGICGLLVGMLDELFFSHQLYATDIEFTADKGGESLLKTFKRWAQEKGAGIAFCGVSNDSNRSDRVLDRFYRMHGFNKTGGMYCSRLK